MTALAGHKGKIGAAMLLAWLLSRFSLSSLSAVRAILVLAIENDESFYLVMASALSAVSNAIRAALLYCGWFLAAEGAAERTGKPMLAWALPALMIPVSYQISGYFHLPSVPQFGFSAFFTLLSVLFLQYICRDISRTGYKILIQVLIVMAIQWLDVIPPLTGRGFGTGEMSLAVKSVAVLMDKDDMSGSICAIFFFFNALVALLMARLFVNYEKQLSQLNLIQLRERDLIQLRHQQATTRLYQELQLLVHDLKRPLTVILGLTNLLSLSAYREVASHAEIILEATEGMNQMIDEIKTPLAMRKVNVGELLDYTMSQVRPLSWGESVIVEASDDVKRTVLKINLIRFSRALVNLLDNASNASGLNGGGSLVKISAASGEDKVIINIEDNGPGFSSADKSGVSAWGSTGLGLVFVKQVIEGGDCSISYKDRPGGGTVCSVLVPVLNSEVSE